MKRSSHRWVRNLLISFLEEDLQRASKLSASLSIVLLRPPTGSQSIAECGKMPECARLARDRDKQKEIDLRRGYSYDYGPAGDCRPVLLADIQESVHEAKPGGYRICLDTIKHLWINLYDRKKRWVGTIYFGPFIEKGGSTCNIAGLPAAETLPRLFETEVKCLGDDLAIVFAPIMTHVLSPASEPTWVLIWMLCEFFLPNRVKERVWIHAFGHLLEDWIERLHYPQKRLRLVFHAAFCFRTMMLSADCIVAMLRDSVAPFLERFGRDLWQFVRDLWDFFRKR